MRVGFVLRSAEIKPLVPKICAGVFSYEKHQCISPPPPLPPRESVPLSQHCKHYQLPASKRRRKVLVMLASFASFQIFRVGTNDHPDVDVRAQQVVHIDSRSVTSRLQYAFWHLSLGSYEDLFLDVNFPFRHTHHWFKPSSWLVCR